MKSTQEHIDVVIIPISPDQNDAYRYKFGGKELQEGLGLDWYDFGARNYDAALGRWMNIDPLAEERVEISPYNYVQNNPLVRIDSDGALDSPIYDIDGDFLGTDDEGLQGKAIVMNKSDFTQGMEHSEAMSKNLGLKGLNSFTSAMKLANSYEHLPERPDYDGVVTISEGIKWAKDHPNTLPNRVRPENSLYLDASKLNFGSLSVSDLQKEGFSEGTKANINLFNYVNLLSKSSRSTTYALGNTQMKLLNVKTGSVRLFYDDYDWDYHNTAGSVKRDNLIFLERVRTHVDDSHGFRVHIYGTGKIKTN